MSYLLTGAQTLASPLHLAASALDQALVDFFLECGMDINLAGASGRTPLHSALRSGTTSLPFIRYLLSRGADAKAIDDTGLGALHHALAVRSLLPYFLLSSPSPFGWLCSVCSS
jgi:ankyrin repeat protein